MAPRKASDQELSREQILRVARDLFASRGYRAVSMRSIANALSCSHGALYYHFRDKADLFLALVAEDFSQLRDRLHQVLRQPPDPAFTSLQRIMLEFIRFGLERPKHYEIMFLVNDPELLNYAQPEKMRCYEEFAAAVREACGKEQVSGKQAFLVPWSLFLALHGFVSHYLAYGFPYEEIEGVAEEYVRFLTRELASFFDCN